MTSSASGAEFLTTSSTFSTDFARSDHAVTTRKARRRCNKRRVETTGSAANWSRVPSPPSRRTEGLRLRTTPRCDELVEPPSPRPPRPDGTAPRVTDEPHESRGTPNWSSRPPPTRATPPTRPPPATPRRTDEPHESRGTPSDGPTVRRPDDSHSPSHAEITVQNDFQFSRAREAEGTGITCKNAKIGKITRCSFFEDQKIEFASGYEIGKTYWRFLQQNEIRVIQRCSHFPRCKVSILDCSIRYLI